MKLKLRRNSIMPLLFIVILCLIILPILAYYMDNMIEGFTTTYRPPNFFDRILFTKNSYDRNYIDSNGVQLDMSGSYGYCLGGKIKCTGGSSLVELSSSYPYGKTYSGLCSDNETRPVCADNYYGDPDEFTDASMAENYNKRDSVMGTKGSIGGINILDPENYRGFVGPYSAVKPTTAGGAYYPFTTDSSLNKTFEYRYYESGKDEVKLVSNKGKCWLVNDENRAYCNTYFYDLDNNDKGYSSSSSSTDDKTSDDSNDDDIDGYDAKETSYASADDTSDATCGSKIPCIADFGTNVGDNLCCGQTGVLQNTKYVCPSNAPKCSNFKCGSKFGTCSA
jgi:hypothetical protein